MNQRVEDFTIGIVSKNNSTPLGTGFVIDVIQGLIVTAYHVVEAALEISKSQHVPNYARLSIRYPNQGITGDAEFISQRSDKQADIATLRARLPKGIVSSRLGSSINSVGGKFVSTGYRQVAGGAVGDIAPPELESTRNKYRRLILWSDQIDRGMSGAPVLHVASEQVIGMIVSFKNVEKNSSKDINTAFAVPSEAIYSLNPDVEFNKSKETFSSPQNIIVAIGAGAASGVTAYQLMHWIDEQHASDDNHSDDAPILHNHHMSHLQHDDHHTESIDTLQETHDQDFWLNDDDGE